MKTLQPNVGLRPNFGGRLTKPLAGDWALNRGEVIW